MGKFNEPRAFFRLSFYEFVIFWFHLRVRFQIPLPVQGEGNRRDARVRAAATYDVIRLADDDQDAPWFVS